MDSGKSVSKCKTIALYTNKAPVSILELNNMLKSLNDIISGKVVKKAFLKY